MRIGLDGIPLTDLRTGIGTYTFELANALAIGSPADDFELVSPFPYSTMTGGDSRPENLRLVHSKSNVLMRRWWVLGLPLYLRRVGLTLFHGTNFEVPLWRGCPTVVTIHDLSPLRLPKMHQGRLRRRARFSIPFMARLATAIITPSESVRSEVCERLGIPADKVVAIPHGPRRCFRPLPLSQTTEVRNRLGIADEFLLAVGTIEPRKNLITLVRAFQEILKTTTLRPQLVIVGKEGWLTGELFTHIKKAQLGDRLLCTGYLSDEELCALYSSCRAFIYPSIYEGFGLPPLEAMACGAPVITSRIPSLVETVGSAALLVSPTDVQDMSRTIIGLLKDDNEREKLSAAGQKRAAEFSWDRTARLTRDVYDRALRKESRRGKP